MKRKQLSKSDVRDYNEAIGKLYSIDDSIDRKAKNELVQGDITLISSDGEFRFFLYDGKPIPTLKECIKDCFLKKVTVDMGAVKFVASGADIMRPGIVGLEEGILKGDIVAVIDEKNRVPLAVCMALYDGQDILAMKSGKALKSLHYVGDKIWNFRV